MSTAAPKRPKALTLLIALNAAGVLNALWTVAAEPEAFHAAFPGLTPALFAAYLATVAGIVATLVGLWRMDRWAAPLLIAVGAVSCVLDLLAGAPIVHLAATIGSTSLIILVLFPHRSWFLAGQTSIPANSYHSSS